MQRASKCSVQSRKMRVCECQTECAWQGSKWQWLLQAESYQVARNSIILNQTANFNLNSKLRHVLITGEEKTIYLMIWPYPQKDFWIWAQNSRGLLWHLPFTLRASWWSLLCGLCKTQTSSWVLQSPIPAIVILLVAWRNAGVQTACCTSGKMCFMYCIIWIITVCSNPKKSSE